MVNILLRPSIITLASLGKRRFCQHRRHSEIGIANFGGILNHSARVLKKAKILMVVNPS
jgi:hypothetical protein